MSCNTSWKLFYKTTQIEFGIYTIHMVEICLFLKHSQCHDRENVQEMNLYVWENVASNDSFSV